MGTLAIEDRGGALDLNIKEIKCMWSDTLTFYLLFLSVMGSDRLDREWPYMTYNEPFVFLRCKC